jgi:hypothetical protein
VLAVNGVVFLVRAGLDIVRPTSFYLAAGAPAYAVDAVRVLGITYATLALVQLGVSRLADPRAVRLVAAASMLFAAAVAVQASLQSSGTTDAFHRLRWGSAAENVLVATLYAMLLYRGRPAGRGDDRVPCHGSSPSASMSTSAPTTASPE